MTTLSLANAFLFGAVFLGFSSASVFFLKFWRKSGDSLFLMFALAFALLAIERFPLTFLPADGEFRPYIYIIRLIAHLLILVAIINKNRAKAGK